MQVPTAKEWGAAVKPYRQPILWRSIWQIINTGVPFFVIWWLMYRSLEVSYFLTLALSVPAAGLVVRFFIINHDCGHGSFFRSTRANDIVGFWTGLFSFTPYRMWRHGHALHHASSGQIEDRGVGYFWIMTLKEYREASAKKRAWYRFYRNPIVLFTLGGAYLFMFEYRFSFTARNRREKIGVWQANLVLGTVFWLVGSQIGYWELFLVQFPIGYLATTTGLVLFYFQHHYDDSYWAPKETWSYEAAAFHGSSYLKLDPVTEWFAGYINYHHIHHLAPKVPNYRLREAHNAVPMFRNVEPLRLSKIATAWRLRLVDEETSRWVDFPKDTDSATAVAG